MAGKQPKSLSLGRVVRPLVERGYLTWQQAGFAHDPTIDDPGPYTGIIPLNDDIHHALLRFQHDSGFQDPHHITGHRTLNALGQQVSPLEVSTLIERNLKEQSAQVSIQNTADAQGVADNIVAIRRAYPTLAPRVTAALGLSGYGAHDEIVKNLATAQMSNHAKSFWETFPTSDTVDKNSHNNGNLVDQWAAQLDQNPNNDKTAKPDQAASDDGGLMGEIGSAIKGVSRVGFTALETPYQGLVGAGRNAIRGVAAGSVALNTGQVTPAIAPPEQRVGDIAGIQAMSEKSPVSIGQQTSGGIALNEFQQGHRVDLGTGFFPGGNVETVQARNSRRALSIAGHAATPGRLAAALVTEPGTTPYNVLSGLVDAASITYADPANLALSKISDVREARKVLTAAPEVADEAPGLLNGIRRTILPQSAERWISQSAAGQKLVKKLALNADQGDKGALTYLETLKVTKGDAALAAQLHAAATPTEVLDALRPALGIGLREKPTTPYQWTKPFRDVTNGWRFTGSVPEHLADATDLDGMVNNVDNWLRNAKVSLEDRNRVAQMIATAPGREGRYAAVAKTGAGLVEDQLIKYGKHPNEAKNLTKLFQGWDEFRHFMIDQTGQDVTPFFTVDGKAMAGKTPAYFIDFLNRTIPLPNVREIRGAVSFAGAHPRTATAIGAGVGGATGYALSGDLQGTTEGALAGAFLGNPRGRDLATIAADQYMKIWKPLALARFGLPIRVIAESQAAMAMQGYDSMLKHPIHFISQVMGSSTDLFGADFEKVAKDAIMKGDTTDYLQALSGWSRQYISNRDELGRRLKGFHVIDAETDPATFTRAWHERLSRLSTDPIARHLRTHGRDATKRWLWDGEGAAVRNEMLNGPEDITWALSSRSGVSTYVDNIATDLATHAWNDEAIHNAIGSGKLTIDGKTHNLVDVIAGGKPKYNKEVRAYLADKVAQGDSPAKMIGQASVSAGRGQETRYWDTGVQYMFDHLMTIPTNKLAYSPLFNQAYWDRVSELAPHMTSEHRAAAAAVAEEHGLKGPAKIIRAATGDAARTLAPADVDTLAKAYALNETKDALHNLAHKGQFFDIWRNIIPFGEAWKQIITRWSKITYEHPETLRKFQVALGGAKDIGFFQTNPTTGQEEFNYPGTEWATKEWFGVPTPLSGSVEGLNVIGNGTPGVGPLVQIPVSYFLPDTPDTDWVRRYVSPFGDQSKMDPKGNPVSTALNYLTPPWASKMLQAATGSDADRNFANSTMAMAAYLRTTGHYGPKDQDKLLADAKSDAKAFAIVRAAGNLTTPSAPIPDAQVKDHDGNLLMLNALKDEYRSAQDAGEQAGKSYDQIDQDFIAKYGLDIYGALQPYTYALVQSLPVTKSQIDWERRNKGFAEKYPDVYGFFTPPSKPGEQFDQQAYDRQVANGQRQRISLKTWNQMANDRIASHLYYAARDQAGDHPSKQDRDALAKYHDELLNYYPGFESDQGKIGRASPDQILKQLHAAVKDPAVAKTTMGQAVASLLNARDTVAAQAKERHVRGWQTANATLDLRQHLADYYRQIREWEPGAARLIDTVFSGDTRGT